MANHNAGFVGGSRNIGLLTGYAKRISSDHIVLMQGENETQHLTIQVPRTSRSIRSDIPFQVRVHATAIRVDNVHRITLTSIEPPRRASIGDAPQRVASLNALRQAVGIQRDAGASPFGDLEATRQEIKAALLAKNIDPGAVDEMLRDTAKKPKFDRFTNHFVLSGFVGHKAYYPAPEGAPDDHGYCVFMVHQQADPAKAVPIRVRGADSRFLKLLPAMQPVNVIASARNIESGGETITVLEATRDNVGGATVRDFLSNTFPGWWADAVSAFYASRKKASTPTLIHSPQSGDAEANDVDAAGQSDTSDASADEAGALSGIDYDPNAVI